MSIICVYKAAHLRLLCVHECNHSVYTHAHTQSDLWASSVMVNGLNHYRLFHHFTARLTAQTGQFHQSTSVAATFTYLVYYMANRGRPDTDITLGSVFLLILIITFIQKKTYVTLR